ncbi:TPA: DUF3303 family protein [Pseudomonas putida]|jgi:hypothetical protein|uniref:DUF3303 domain-containing protein n=1 Tax=Pseudomonas TaxID=286 RepID=UPI000488285E|nr:MULTISPECIES: DUF3303 family protein [Pseudomonas]MDD2149794.1 DUF3303 domain-containing protein [Pseudomonas putida]RAS33974.1 uncharacterized protein DUF3303 [Pseudomonas sp. URMO17WK12:I7]SME89971.1 Protein of unknown function [Pseudomonas sp. URMO17WK12:I5]HDS1679677.1 DUF3303 family protein [Pseudomonas putida]
MLFIIQWSIAPENRNAVMARFAKTGGVPPAELKVHGRWHAVGELQGFAVVESNDLQPVLHWTLDWSDLMHMQVCPAMTDTELAPILAAAVSKMTH